MAQLLSGTRIYGTATIDTQVLINGTVAATSTITGALQVVGGVGIGKDLWIGGNIYGSVVGTITTATNIAGGLRGQLVYQQSPGVTSFVGTGTIGQLLMSSGTSAPLYVNTSAIFVGYSDKANNLGGGTIMSIPYQSTTGSTAYLAAANTAGWILTTNGTGVAPAWVNPVTAVAPSNLTVSTGTAFEYIIGVPSAGSSQAAIIATTVNAQVGFNAQTGLMGIGTITPSQKLDVYSNAGTVSAAVRSAFSGGSAQLLLAGNNTAVGTGEFLISHDGSSVAYLYNRSNTAMIFGTNNSEKMRITNNGGIAFNGAANYGTSGYVLQSNGDAAPTWVNVGALSAVTSSTQINTVGTTTNITFYPAFVNANNSTPTAMNVYTTGSFSINPSTSNVGIGQSPGTQKLEVYGGIKVTSSATTGATLGTSGAVLDYFYPTTRMYIGDGTGWDFRITKRNASVSTDLFTFLDTGGLGFNGATGSAGQILQSNGTSSPTWVSTGSVVAGNSTNAIFVLTTGTSTNASYYPTFVSANNTTAAFMLHYTTSSFVINPNTGNVGIGTTTPALSLDVAGRGRFLQNVAATSGAIVLRQSASDTEGAFIQWVNNANTIEKGWLYVNTTSNMIFATGSTERMRISSTGNVGINNASPSFPLDVTGNARVTGNFTATGSLTVGITTSSATAGEIRATNEITAYYTSDARLKENVQVIEDPITMIDQIRGVYFDWTDEYIKSRGGEDGYFVRKHDIGVIAQEIEAILPEIVATRDTGFKAVKYEKIIPLLIEAIKTQQRQIDQIQSMLNNLINK